MREQKADPVHSFPGEGRQKPEQAELTRLRREVAKLKMERDIVKKAAMSSTGRCNGRYKLHHRCEIAKGFSLSAITSSSVWVNTDRSVL